MIYCLDYRPKKRANDSVFVVRQMHEISDNSLNKLYCASVDCENVSDRVCRELAKSDESKAAAEEW